MGIHTFYGQVLQQLVTPILAYLPDLPFYVPCCIIFKSLEYALLNVFSYRRSSSAEGCGVPSSETQSLFMKTMLVALEY